MNERGLSQHGIGANITKKCLSETPKNKNHSGQILQLRCLSKNIGKYIKEHFTNIQYYNKMFCACVFIDVRIPYKIRVWILMKSSLNLYCSMINRIYIFLSKFHNVLETKCKIDCQMLNFWRVQMYLHFMFQSYTQQWAYIKIEDLLNVPKIKTI